DDRETLAVLCGKILNRNKPGHPAHKCYHLLKQGLQLLEIRLWFHVSAKDDDDHRGTPLQLSTLPPSRHATTSRPLTLPHWPNDQNARPAIVRALSTYCLQLGGAKPTPLQSVRFYAAIFSGLVSCTFCF